MSWFWSFEGNTDPALVVLVVYCTMIGFIGGLAVGMWKRGTTDDPPPPPPPDIPDHVPDDWLRPVKPGRDV